MKLGHYDDFKYKKNIHAKIACIVPIYVRADRVEKYELRGRLSPDVYKNYEEDKLETVKFMKACHEHYSSGVDYELIFIDNSTPNQEAKQYLKECGVTVWERENKGFSFGAYDYAWKKYRDTYDYYLFHEQDVVPSKDGWLKEIVDMFLSDRQIGAVGNVLESRGWGHPLSDAIMSTIPTLRDRKYMYNFDGAFTFTSSRILKEVDDVGGLFISPCDGTDDIGSIINETGFQQPILEMGYKIASFDGGDKFCTHGIAMAEYNNEFIEPGELCPLIHCHVRDNMKWFKKYFNWYYDNR